MSTVNGFQVGSEVLKYNAEALENYNTPDFSINSTYAVGDYVMYLGKLYKCIRAITSSGSDWDASDWELAILSDDVSLLNTAIINIDNSIANDFEPNHLYTSGDIIMHENVLYRCLPSTLEVGTFNPLDWEETTIDYTINNLVDTSLPSGGTTNQYLMKNSDLDYDLKWSNLIEGTNNTVSGEDAHAEGISNTASGIACHAEGSSTTASTGYSHSEGYGTTASGTRSHAEGHSTVASGINAHAEGYYCQSSGDDAHSEGYYTTASGHYSHAEGQRTIANHRSQHVFGEFNIADPSNKNSAERGDYVEIVGNGASPAHRSNIRTLDWSGNEVLTGGLTIGSTGLTIGSTTITESQLIALLAMLN